MEPMRPANTKQDNNENLREQILQLEKNLRRLSISRQLTWEFVGHTAGIKDLISKVFSRVLSALDAQAGFLWIADPESEQNICHLAEGVRKEHFVGLRQPRSIGVVGKVIDSQEAKIVRDCRQDQDFLQHADKRIRQFARSMLCVPLVIDGESYGAIQIINKKHGINGQFDDDDCDLVKDLVVVASLSMKNARLLEMESRVKEMNILMTISQEVVATLDLDHVLHLVVNKTNELVDISLGAIALWDEQVGALKLRVLSGDNKLDSEDKKQQDLLLMMEQVRKIERSSYVASLSSYKKSLTNPDNAWVHYMESHSVNAIWSTPLQDEEGNLGVLWFESDVPGFVNGSKADLLYILATQATLALRNASLFKNIPFHNILTNVGQKSRRMVSSGWKKMALVLAIIAVVVTSLHYLPVFRWVSGQAVVEARLGLGIFLPVAGRVEKVFVDEGDSVVAGDPLIQLDGSVFRLLLVEADSQLAVLDRQIIEARAASDAAAMSRFLVEREGVRAKANKARADLAQIVINAPVDGLVLTSSLSELKGRFFNLGDEIMRLADPQHLMVIIHIPEVDLLDIQLGQQVKGVLRARPGEYFTGQIRHIGRSYDIPSTSLEASAEVEPTDVQTGFIAEVEKIDSPFVLRPGMTGQALIHTPKTSVIVRFWRRIRNFIWFNLGL